MQFHEVIRMDDPEKIFAKGGSFEAALEAKQAGKIRYIGFTGHKSPEVHLHMLEVCLAHGFTPATVQMPLNVMDAHYNSFGHKVLPELVKHNIGVLGMKPMGAGFILKQRRRDADRMPPLRDESADQRRHHRMRIGGERRAGNQCGDDLQADDAGAGRLRSSRRRRRLAASDVSRAIRTP